MAEEDKTASIRAFLAVEPPADIRNGIADIQTRLKRKFGNLVRWVRPEGMHLTLKFFGDISADDVKTISEVVKEKVKGASPMALWVRKLGAFPNPNRPRVIWLGIDGDVNRLLILQKKIEHNLQEYGFTREERSFSPHLTLGRIKTPRGLIGLAGMIEEGGNYTAGEFQAEALTLFKSELRPEGALYTQMGYFPFDK